MRKFTYIFDSLSWRIRFQIETCSNSFRANGTSMNWDISVISLQIFHHKCHKFLLNWKTQVAVARNFTRNYNLLNLRLENLSLPLHLLWLIAYIFISAHLTNNDERSHRQNKYLQRQRNFHKRTKPSASSVSCNRMTAADGDMTFQIEFWLLLVSRCVKINAQFIFPWKMY